MVSGQTADKSGKKTIDIRKRDLPVEEGGLRWRLVKNFWLWRRKNLLWQGGVVGLALGRQYDTIIYQGDLHFVSTWISAVLARLTGKRVLMWTIAFIKDERGIKCWLRMRFLRLAHGLLIYSNRVAHMLTERGYPAERIYVVFNSLDWDKQKAIRERITDEMRRQCRAQLFADPERPVLVMTGRLVARKQTDVLLKAVAKLAEEGFDANVLLIGDGPEERSLREQAERLNIADRVVFYGACYDEEELGLMISASDLCVSPGQIGLTCMHSLSYGTPCITHDDPNTQAPEYEAILPGKTGRLFRRSDVTDLTRAIREWIVTHRDREAVRRDCYRMIDGLYNPHFQLRVINAAVQGVPADRVPCGHTQYPPLFPQNAVTSFE